MTERTAQRKSPHLTAAKFRTEQRPTLINFEQEYLAYDGLGAYRVIKDDTIAAEVQAYLEDAAELRPAPAIGHTKPQMKPFPFNPKTADVLQITGALERKNHVAPGSISPPFFLAGEFDYSAFDPRDIISCRNGLLEISTRVLYPPTPQFFTRSALPIEYDPDARPDRWLTFLDEILQGDVELILLIQQWFGYLCTSDTSYQKILYLQGVSNSGKSTLMRVLDALIGIRNICNPSIADLAERSTLNDMSACTLAKITDMNSDDRQKLSEASSVMNRISGEDPVHIFRKFKDGLELLLFIRFVLAGNQFPNFGEHAAALARRLLVVPFRVNFEDVADPDLSRKLIAELPGILNWALDGLDNLRDVGRFIEPAASIVAKREILNSGDPLRSFVTDECELAPDYQASKSDLFARYQQHCQVVGAKHPQARDKFLASLKTAYNGVVPARRGDGVDREHVMRGIRLRDTEATPTITKIYRLDPWMLDLGIARTDPQAMLRDARGDAVEMHTADFDDD
jgi:putative DNA primase/helicase